MPKDRPLTCLIKIKKEDNKMSKKNISVTIALILILAFLITGCGPTIGGGNKSVRGRSFDMIQSRI